MPSTVANESEVTVSLKLNGIITLAALTSACAGQPTAPAITPRDLQIVSGDLQNGTRGSSLTSPLRVRVMGTDGRPFVGAAVRWTVSTGQATLDPVESLTEKAGEAETHMPVIATVGAIQVRASVDGVTPVVFSISGRHPCRLQPTALATSIAADLFPLGCDVSYARPATPLTARASRAIHPA
jgi:hypothetical protein